MEKAKQRERERERERERDVERPDSLLSATFFLSCFKQFQIEKKNSMKSPPKKIDKHKHSSHQNSPKSK